MKNKSLLLSFLGLLTGVVVNAQVSSVEFGKNRVQFEKFNWKYYQTENFNTYFSQDGLGLGKYVTQIAEEVLPELENFIEQSSQRRINIVVYNNFDEMRQSNIGMNIDWQTTGGTTKFVNNKMLVYFDGNHDNLRKQIRQGIAKVLVQNVLFGDDLGEVAANAALLDLPVWLTEGYITYAAENWSTSLDDELRATMLAGTYKNFYQFAHEKPLLAGHSFWKYFADRYGKNKVTYFLYLARIYKNLNNASQKIAGKKFKKVLEDFMLEVPQNYFKDIRGRRNSPKGQLSVSETIGKKDYIRFNASPVPRSFNYALVEFKKGIYSVVLVENFVKRKVLVKFGERTQEEEKNPNYPLLAWDQKGTRLAVLYSHEGKLKFFIYDLLSKVKTNKQVWDWTDQVQDMKFMLNNNTLVLSAIRSGQTDIYTYDIGKQTYDQITNDIYDDLDPSFVSFPNKSGIIYSSNRPNAYALSGEDSLPGKRFNIFLVDNFNQSEFKQISQLSDVKFGNARFPSQYNNTHFTFVSDENGINNRYAGFFKTERAGLDTLVYIGDEVLRNPSLTEVDSLLGEWQKSDIDSVGFVSVTNDSSYVFPLSNYQSSLLETRVAGDNQQVSEVIRLGTVKLLYRLKVDENVLRRRNINAKPTEYMRQVIEEAKRASNPQATIPVGTDDKKPNNAGIFQSEFEDEPAKNPSNKPTDNTTETVTDERTYVLKDAKLYEYKPPKYFVDYAVTAFNNSTLTLNKFQKYTGNGPIYLSNGNSYNGLIRMGTSDLFEDYKFTGGVRMATNLKDNDVFFNFTNQRKRLDWGATYFLSTLEDVLDTFYYGKIHETYLLVNLKYPFSRISSLRANIGPRFTSSVYSALDPQSLAKKTKKATYGQISLEYVYDNTLNPASNIWKGLRFKVFTDIFTQMSKETSVNNGAMIFNAGFDGRHYLPIYRNVTWAVRAAGDFSWGDQKVLYYLGGVDNWFNPKFSNVNKPNPNNIYTYQSLAVNMRGFQQNVANGNNALVLNSEVRVPVFSTFFNKPINNAFLRNFQVIQFFDLGTAWSGSVKNISRPGVLYPSSQPNGDPITMLIKAGGLGPLAGGYGFGARSTLLGYFLRFDVAWEMNGFFRGKPMTYIAMGFDF